MKGLLLKDWYMAAKTCRIHLGIVVMTSVVSLFIDSGVWYLVYPILFAGMIPVYLLSVDEKWDWGSYAQCLPYARREVVTVKYLDSLLAVGSTVLFMTVLWLGKFVLFGGGSGFSALLRTMGLVFCAGLIFPALMLPTMLRFGVEKGRYLMAAGVGIAVFVIVLVLPGPDNAPQGMATAYAMDIAVRAGWKVPGLLLGMLVLFFLSWLLAVRLYEKREL